jgi:hypothetical protein
MGPVLTVIVKYICEEATDPAIRGRGVRSRKK